MSLFNKDKYDINAEDNYPQIVYGPPKEFIEKKDESEDNLVFDAFIGGYGGPSSYYYIERVNDHFDFKYGYSESGFLIDTSSSLLKIASYNRNEYENFINGIIDMTKNWNITYNNNDIMDGTQWHIIMNVLYNEKRVKFSGSNDYPSNFKEVISFIENVFGVDPEHSEYNIDPEDNIPREVYGIPDFLLKKKQNEKYDINPENNIPQRVYGVPNPNINNYNINPEDNIPQKVYGVFNPEKLNEEKSIKGVNIVINDLSLLVIETKLNASLLYKNMNDISYISDVVTIPSNSKNDFFTKLNNIISKWDNSYNGNKNIKWNITITYENEKKNISGNGEVPKSWNEFIDLVSEYEILYKKIIISNQKESDSKDKAKKALKEIENEVDDILIQQGLMNIVDGKKIPAFGSCHTRWEIEKRILKERYNIDWKTPSEENPFINYD